MKMIQMISDAIKSVYASAYFKDSKAYMTATSNVIDEEKMGIVMQAVCGKKYGDRFYPSLSGVARSINFYPIEPEKSKEINIYNQYSQRVFNTTISSGEIDISVLSPGIYIVEILINEKRFTQKINVEKYCLENNRSFLACKYNMDFHTKLASSRCDNVHSSRYIPGSVLFT